MDIGTKKFLEVAIQKMTAVRSLLGKIEDASKSGEAAAEESLRDAGDYYNLGIAYLRNKKKTSAY